MPSRRSRHVHVCILPCRVSRSTAQRSSSLTAATGASPCGTPRRGCATGAASAPRAAGRASCCAPPALLSMRSTSTWPTRATTGCASSRTVAPFAWPSEGAAALVETRDLAARSRRESRPRHGRSWLPPGPGRPHPPTQHAGSELGIPSRRVHVGGRRPPAPPAAC